MGEILGLETGISAPTFVSTNFGGSLTIILAIVIFFIAAAIGIWLFIRFKTFNKKIILFENVAGQGYQVTFRDRARLVKIGDGGEEILYLQKKKCYRTAYGKKMGKNTYWFAVGQDGYWYNVLLGDLDAKMGMLDIEPIDRDMRYMHVAIRKNIVERYRKVGIMEKYGTMIISGIVLLIMVGCMWFLIDQVGDLIKIAIESMKASKESNDVVLKILSNIDSIKSGGSGISKV